MPQVEQPEKPYPSPEGCGLDKGYHSPANRAGLDQLLRTGRLSMVEQERDREPTFRAVCQVESAINNI